MGTWDAAAGVMTEVSFRLIHDGSYVPSLGEVLHDDAVRHFVRGVIYMDAGNLAFALGSWRKAVRKTMLAYKYERLMG